MKAPKVIVSVFVSFGLSAIYSSAFAQDTIQKLNGEYIFCKVLEIGTNSVSYKKKGFEDGPTYNEELKTVANIRYKGHRDDYKKSKVISTTTTNTASTTVSSNIPANPDQKLPPVLAGSETNAPKEAGKNPSGNNGSNSQGPTTPSNTGTSQNPALQNGPVSNQYKIDHFDKKYLINGQKVSPKAVDKLLAQSSNPLVVTMAKSAKIMKKTQKAMKIISFPSTIAGGIASISSFSSMYDQINANGASFNSIKDFGLSFLGTLTGPITSKLLKKKTNKMYDKTIDLYNMQN
ncbi:MAG: hypothetical protein ACJ77K_19780 [Bacteroidia bacterium]